MADMTSGLFEGMERATGNLLQLGQRLQQMRGEEQRQKLFQHKYEQELRDSELLPVDATLANMGITGASAEYMKRQAAPFITNQNGVSYISRAEGRKFAKDVFSSPQHAYALGTIKLDELGREIIGLRQTGGPKEAQRLIELEQQHAAITNQMRVLKAIIPHSFQNISPTGTLDVPEDKIIHPDTTLAGMQEGAKTKREEIKAAAKVTAADKRTTRTTSAGDDKEVKEAIRRLRTWQEKNYGTVLKSKNLTEEEQKPYINESMKVEQLIARLENGTLNPKSIRWPETMVTTEGGKQRLVNQNAQPQKIGKYIVEAE